MPSSFWFSAEPIGFCCLTAATIRCLAHLDSLTCRNLQEVTQRCLPRHLMQKFSAPELGQEGGIYLGTQTVSLSLFFFSHLDISLKVLKANVEGGSRRGSSSCEVWSLCHFGWHSLRKGEKNYEYTFRYKCECLFRMREENENKPQNSKSWQIPQAIQDQEK